MNTGQGETGRPISATVIPVLLLLFALGNLLSAGASVNPLTGTRIPDGIKAFSLFVALVQGSAGVMLINRMEAGRKLYLIAMPLLILGLASYSPQALLSFIGYGAFAFFLTRPRFSAWLARESDEPIEKRSYDFAVARPGDEASPDQIAALKRIAGDEAVQFASVSEGRDLWKCVCGTNNDLVPEKPIQNCTQCHRNRDYTLDHYSFAAIAAKHREA